MSKESLIAGLKHITELQQRRATLLREMIAETRNKNDNIEMLRNTYEKEIDEFRREKKNEIFGDWAHPPKIRIPEIGGNSEGNRQALSFPPELSVMPNISKGELKIAFKQLLLSIVFSAVFVALIVTGIQARTNNGSSYGLHGCLVAFTIVAAVIFFPLYVYVFNEFFLPVWLVKKIVAYRRFSKEKRLWEASFLEWETKFNAATSSDSMRSFYEKFQKCDAVYRNFVDECTRKCEEAVVNFSKQVQEIEKQYAEKIEKIQANEDAVKAELDQVTIISSQLFDSADEIASKLELGRADSLKEAINLTIIEEEQERREGMARLAESRRNENLEEERRRREDEMQKKACEEQRLRCWSCVYNDDCPVKGRITNCASFVPTKRYF